MIRFVDLGDQITCDGTKQFAWFYTVTESFQEYSGNQVWDSWLEFETDFRHDEKQVYLVGYGIPNTLDRYKKLFQWKKDESKNKHKK